MIIDVAAGVLLNSAGEVLLAQRPEGKHMAGYWEFPGGKFEEGEDAAAALHRELAEELGIRVFDSQPLIELVHHYPERSIRLHVRVVERWQGQPQSLDQQALAWVKKQEMDQWHLLPADGPIVKAIQLPALVAVSPELPEGTEWETIQPTFEQLHERGIRAIQWRQDAFRSNATPSAASLMLAKQVAAWASDNGWLCLLNEHYVDATQPSWAQRLGFAGLHLPEALAEHHGLNGVKAESLRADTGLLLSAACHCRESMMRAQELGVDFAFAGTVLRSQSHPQTEPLGWQGFRKLTELARIPVYAIGGCEPAMITEARENGGQGIAAIRSLWLETKAG